MLRFSHGTTSAREILKSDLLVLNKCMLGSFVKHIEIVMSLPHENKHLNFIIDERDESWKTAFLDNMIPLQTCMERRLLLPLKRQLEYSKPARYYNTLGFERIIRSGHKLVVRVGT